MPDLCNYFVTFLRNDTPEYCDFWQNEEYQKIEEKPYDLLSLKKVGVTQINLLGGEPLLREDLLQILKQAKALGFRVKLITNGIYMLRKHHL